MKEKEMTLHEEFYSFRKKVWKEFEKTVKSGCSYIGEFPVMGDTRSPIVIHGIEKDVNYSIHRGEDIIIGSGKIKIITKDIFTGAMSTKDVEPDILDLQELSTYLSEGFAAYK